eukprot:755889-Hanusia_phi.AAC.4
MPAKSAGATTPPASAATGKLPAARSPCLSSRFAADHFLGTCAGSGRLRHLRRRRELVCGMRRSPEQRESDRPVWNLRGRQLGVHGNQLPSPPRLLLDFDSDAQGCDGVAINPRVTLITGAAVWSLCFLAFSPQRAGIAPKKFDVCNVCGGCNVSCMGCDGVPDPNVPKEYNQVGER